MSRRFLVTLTTALAAGCSLFPDAVVVGATSDGAAGVAGIAAGGTAGAAGGAGGESGAAGSAGTAAVGGEGGTGPQGGASGVGATGGSGGTGGVAGSDGGAAGVVGGASGSGAAGAGMGGLGGAGAGGASGVGAASGTAGVGGTSGTAGVGGSSGAGGTGVDASVTCTAPGALPNWSFEQTMGTMPTQWIRDSGTGTFSGSASNSFDGSRSGYVDTTTVVGGPGVVIQTVASARIPVAAGQLVAASVYFRNLEFVAGSEPTVVLEFFGNGGVPMPGSEAVLFSVPSTGAWVKRGDVGAVAPAGARELRLLIRNTAGWRYFVDAACVQGL